MRSFLNADELFALRGLPHAARTLYREGLRPLMDYQSRVVGVKRRLSYQAFKELLEVNPEWGSNQTQYAPTKSAMRNMLRQLQRAGLVEPVLREGKAIPLVFKLVLADCAEVRLKKERHGECHEERHGFSASECGFSQEERHGEQHEERHTSDNTINYLTSSKTVSINTPAIAADDGSLGRYQYAVQQLLVDVGRLSLVAVRNPKSVQTVRAWFDAGASLEEVEQAVRHGVSCANGTPKTPSYFTAIIHDILKTGAPASRGGNGSASDLLDQLGF